MSSEVECDLDTLPRRENAPRQERTHIRIAAARPSARVRHLDLERQTTGNREAMGVDRRRAAVGEPIHAAFRTTTPTARAAAIDQRDVHVE
jgi:hypothetical protein